MRVSVPKDSAGRLSDAWRHCVGTGRFELALRRDYQDSLALVQREIGFRHIRGHGLLSDGVGAYRPYEHQGTRHVHHSFTYVDQVVDAYLDLGVKPFLELGFMPAELASGHQTVFWWNGNVTPPRSWPEWADLVRATVTHLVDRYGLDEVRGWPIETHRQVKKPTYHLYAFMARMGDLLLTRGLDHLVTRDAAGRVTVLAWAPVDETGGGAPAGHTVSLSIPLDATRGAAFALRSSVSEEAGNAWAAWSAMGRPRSPDWRQLDALREVAEPARRHQTLPIVDGRVDLDLTLDRHEVTLVEITAVADETPPWWDEDRILGTREEDA